MEKDKAILDFIDKPFYSKLRIGTDCSGIEAPIQALRQLKIPFEHVFASDIDKYCIQSIKSNYHPQILFGDPDGPYPDGDITNRNIKDVPDIDLYVCGFPCQPFSQAGKRGGFKDKRGNVFWSCLEVIKEKQPKYFILENVKGLLWHDKSKGSKRGEHGNTWTIIWKEIQKLSKYGYAIKWRLLNTRDYGIPQNRERVFIIGKKGKSIDWPNKTNMDNIKNYVDWNIKHYKLPKHILKQFKTVNDKCIFLNNSYRNHHHINADKYCSTLTTSNRYWCIPCKRRMLITEAFKLQGFKHFIIVVSKKQINKQIGNSMSVNVVKAILQTMFPKNIFHKPTPTPDTTYTEYLFV
jgi:DNA (cytosine-5)-methyltransferase 1